MDLEQALQLIDRVLQGVQGTRQDHMAIASAFQVIATAAQRPEEAEPDVKANGKKPVAAVAEK